jgi:hypothetical protein
MSRLRADFINSITCKWQKAVKSAVKSFLEIGHELLAAKAKLRHGEFMAMIEGTDLPFGPRTAECLMSIARHPRLGKPNSQTSANLPPGRWALYELSRLPARQFDAALRDGSINADMTVNEARSLANSVEAQRTRIRYETRPSTQPAREVHIQVTHAPIPVPAVAYVGETKPFTGWGSSGRRNSYEPVSPEQQAADASIDAACLLADANLHAVVKRLKQDRRADIKKVEAGIEAARRLGERLGRAKGSSAKRGSNVVQLRPRKADDRDDEPPAA